MIPGGYPRYLRPHTPEGLTEKRFFKRSLAKRRRAFHLELNSSSETLLLAFTLLEFLKDTSLLKLLVRLVVQLAGFEVLEPSLQQLFSLEEMRKLAVVPLMLCTFYCLGYSALAELPTRNVDGFLIGNWSLQLIGEQPLYGRWVFFFYDLMIFLFQILVFAIRDNYRVAYQAEGGATEGSALIETDDDYDGFQGTVVTAKISILGFFQNVYTSFNSLGRPAG